MPRRRLFQGAIVALILVLFALAASSPTHVAYWAILSITIWWAAPELGATSLPVMIVRHAVLFGAIVIGIPFVVSSPDDLKFWVLLGALFFIVLPGIGAMSWFYGEIRRLDNERKAQPSSRTPNP